MLDGMNRQLPRLALVLVSLLAAAACTASSAAKPASDPLKDSAAALTDLLARNDWSALRRHFDANMRAHLDQAGLATSWREVTALRGPYQSRGVPARVPKPGLFVVFDTPMRFARGPMKSRIAFDPDGEVAGLFILVPNAS